MAKSLNKRFMIINANYSNEMYEKCNEASTLSDREKTKKNAIVVNKKFQVGRHASKFFDKRSVWVITVADEKAICY